MLNDLQPVIDARLARVRTTVSLAQQERREEALDIVKSGVGPDRTRRDFGPEGRSGHK